MRGDNTIYSDWCWHKQCLTRHVVLGIVNICQMWQVIRIIKWWI